MTISDSALDTFLRNPSEYAGFSLERMFSLPERDELQLAALQRRFAQFRPTVAMLRKLADAQNITRLNRIDDVLPLLFDHATYKSYPASLLDNFNFKSLTSWLGKLTVHDLSKVDVSSCRSIDEWMRLMKRETPLSICHTSGTSGRMSFLPVSKDDYLRAMYQWITFCFGGKGVAPPAPLNVPCIYPYFRHGGSAMVTGLDCMVKQIAGSEENFHAAYPVYQSADVMLLAARQRAAAAAGNTESLKVSPELAARRDEFEKLMREMPEHSAKFFRDMCDQLAGKRVFVFATSNLLYMMAEAGLKQGNRRIFAPDSVVVTGGGGKGMVLPDDWQTPVKEFIGVDKLHMMYGMTEACGSTHPMCDRGNYHFVPTIIPFLLDPDTAALLPRKGQQTGRFAFFDALPNCHWGGFITADEVTVEWDAPCGCGWGGPHIVGGIRRISDRKDNGEEKINCAATPAAYEEALEFLKAEA